MPTKKKKKQPWEEGETFQGYLRRRYPKQVPTKKSGYWESPQYTSTQYWGTPEAQETWGIKPLREGSKPEGLAGFASQYDPYVALGNWQNTGDSQMIRLLKARSQYSDYLDYLVTEKTKGKAPEMNTLEWFERESGDIKEMMRKQGYASEAAELTPERPPAKPWWQHTLEGIQRPASMVIGGTVGLLPHAAQLDPEKIKNLYWKHTEGVLGQDFADRKDAETAFANMSNADKSSVMKRTWSEFKSGAKGFDPIGGAKGAWEGLTGDKLWTGTRALKEWGSTGEDWGSKLFRGTMGFTMDVAFDPLTYISIGGLTKAGKAAFGAKAASEFGTQLAPEIAEQAVGKVLLQKLGQPAVTGMSEKALNKAAARLTKYVPAEKLSGWMQRSGVHSAQELLQKSPLPMKSLQALGGQRGLFTLKGHALLTGRPAQKVYQAGEAIQRLVGKTGMKKHFHAIGDVAQWYGTEKGLLADEIRGLATTRRNMEQVKRVLAKKTSAQLTRGMSGESGKIIRDIMEILPAGVLSDPKLAKEFAEGISRQGTDWVKNLKQVRIGEDITGRIGANMPDVMEEAKDFLTRRGITEAEQGILSKTTPEILDRAKSIADVLSLTKEKDIALGLLKRENPAYLPHVWKKGTRTGDPLYEYSTHLGFQERAKQFTLAEYEDALGTKMTRVKELAGQGKEGWSKELLGEVQSEAGLLEFDLQNMLERRLMASAKAQPAMAFQQGVMSLKDEVGDSLVRETMDAAEAVRTGYKQISPQVGGDIAGKWAPAELADEMTKFSMAMQSGKTKNIVARAYDSGQGMWKFMATSFRVGGFNLRNHYSNLWLRYLGGANPATLGHYSRKALVIQAAAADADPNLIDAVTRFGGTMGRAGQHVKRGIKKTAAGMDNVKGLPKAVVKLPNGQMLNADEIMLLAQYEGIHKVGLMGGATDVASRGKDVPWEGASPETTGTSLLKTYGTVKGSARQATKPFRDVSELVERTDRLAFFIEQLEKTGNPELAAKTVRRYLFDYDELSDTERKVFKRILPFYCVAEDTECLTKKGWKLHDQLEQDDILLTYNLDKKEFEWKPLQATFSAQYNYNLMHFESQSVDLLCTFDHRCVTNRGLRPAYQVAQDDTAPMQVVYTKEDHPIPDRILELISWIVTDGYSRKRGNSLEVVVYQKKPEYLAEIKTLVGEDGSESVHPDTGTSCIRINGDTRKEIARHYDGKETLWDLFVNLSPRQLKLAQDTMMKAEGSIARDGTVRRHSHFAQEGQDVLDVFQLITILAGTISNTSKRGLYLRSLPNIKYPKVKIVPYEGIVWCPKTENDTWVSRRNGKVVITGNTWTRKSLPLMAQELVRQPAKFSAVPKMLRAVREFTGTSPDEVSAAEEYMPSWYRSLGAEMIGGTPEKPLFVNPNLPYQELGKLMTVGEFPKLSQVPGLRNVPLPIPRLASFPGTSTGPSLVEGLSPYLKYPIEYSTGKDLWLGRDIEEPVGRQWEAPGWTTLPGIRQVLKPLTGMSKGEDRGDLPAYEWSEEEGLIGEKGRERWQMRGKWVHALNQVPGISELGKIFQAFEQEEPEAGASRLSSFALGIKPLTFDPEAEKTKSKRDEYLSLQKSFEEMKNQGKMGKPIAPEPPYPPDLYQFPEEIKWRQKEMIKKGIPLAKQVDIEGAIQNVLPNLSNEKDKRLELYYMMGYSKDYIETIEALYKQFAKWKKDYKAPEYDITYSGYR